MIIVIGGIKGGTGKTTLATNFAVMRAATGKKVLLVDGDEQRSATKWSNHRDALEIPTSWTTVQFGGNALRLQVDRMRKDYDDIIIDVGGRETTSLRAAISVANICIIPFKPRSFDIWTLGDMKSLLAEMKPANPTISVYAMLNQADAWGSDNDCSLSIIQECDDIECLDITIGSRKAFANAASNGLGVTEMRPVDKKAVKEITDLYEFIYSKHP